MPRVPRIPRPIVDRIPPPIVNSPDFSPPLTTTLRAPTVDVPVIEIPSYEPPTFNPEPQIQTPPVPTPPIENLVPQEEGEGEGEESEDIDPDVIIPDASAGRAVIEVPIIGEVPLPKSNEVALAGTTAVAATAAALLGKSFVELLIKVMKPIVKKAMLKIKEKSGKRFTDLELQEYFAFEETTPELKQVAKRLKAEQLAEKTRQFEEHLRLQRQRRLTHTENLDENTLLDEQPPHTEVIEQVRSRVDS